MKSDNKLIGAGLLTAITASLCCITPVLALIAGTSGIASTFSWIEPFRPYLIGLTILVLGFAWYQKLKSQKKIYCECETDEKPKFLHSKTFLGIVTVFAIVMLAFPYYSGIFYPSTEKQIILFDKSDIKTTEYKISGMTCASCEEHVNHEVNKLNGIVNSKASYENGNAIIEFDRTKTNETEIEKAINLTGYKVTDKNKWIYMKEYDVFIIGSGMAGMTIANKCASKGLTVGITDELPYGGTCALRGCDPKKVIIGATEVRDFAKRLKGSGIDTIPKVKWKDIMAFKQSFVDEMPPKIEKGYKKNGIDTFHSSAKFLSENTLEVGNDKIKAEKIVIASGSKPRVLEFEGGHFAKSSTDFLNLVELPKSLLFIGGGYIAFEFAHIAAQCGAEVTIVHRGKIPWKIFEQDIVKHLVSATKKLGIKLILNTEVTAIEKVDNQYRVKGKSAEKTEYFKAEAVFNSAGRPPAIFDLNLDKANIAFTKKGVTVDKYLQSTSNPHIYAAGDAADSEGLPLTPVAVLEGHTVASNIIKGNSKEISYPPMPTLVFSLPTMASVGCTELKAKELNYNIRINYKEVGNWFNAKRLNVEEYAFKTIIDEETQTILGAHLIGPHTEETINLFAMAIKTKMKVNDIRTMIFSYPTLASDIPHML